MGWEIRQGDALERLREMPDESVQCCVTSPPYWGLRDYGVDRQLGLEETPEQFVAKMVEVFSEVRRVLRADGTCWLNLGDSYNTRQRGSDNGWDKSRLSNPARVQKAQRAALRPRPALTSCKPKDLIGVPWMVAFALRADGWYLRRDIIWAKPNPMPESVTDRPTSSHEYLFLLSKSPRYFYDAQAIREPDKGGDHPRNVLDKPDPSGGLMLPHKGIRTNGGRNGSGRNKRSVWTIATRPYPDAHFATFPPDLVEPCILAGSRKGDVVLDPFAGAGTTLLVATQQGRDAIGIELNPTYAEMAEDRIRRWEANPAGHLKSKPTDVGDGQGSLLTEEAA